MNVAELFVTLGIKGDDKSKKSIKETKGLLSDLSSNALLAKAALVGMFYGLEQLMAKSAGTGNALSQFATFTGKSAEELQRWQYAAQQVGVSGDEITSSVKNVQAAMMSTLQGGNAPSGLAMIINKTGLDMNRARDTFYVMKKLQEFAQQVPADVANDKLKSMGLGEGAINAMRRNAFNDTIMSKAPIYSEKEIGQLQKVGVGWANLGQKIEMAMGRLNAKHGMSLINDINKLIPPAIRLIEVFDKFAKQVELFKIIGTIFEGWADILSGIGNTVETMTQFFSSDKKENAKADKTLGEAWSGTKDFLSGVVANSKFSQEAQRNAMAAGKAPSQMDVVDNFGRVISPNVPAGAAAGASTNVTVEKQEFNFQHDGKDHKRTADHVKKAVRDAYYQNPALNRGG